MALLYPKGYCPAYFPHPRPSIFIRCDKRIRCPSCQEADPVKLPAFQSEAHPGTRIEACDTCRRYVKSIDLTLDMRPIPEVDDLVSIAMDLWAVEQGLTRIEPGLAGL